MTCLYMMPGNEKLPAAPLTHYRWAMDRWIAPPKVGEVEAEVRVVTLVPCLPRSRVMISDWLKLSEATTRDMDASLFHLSARRG